MTSWGKYTKSFQLGLQNSMQYRFDFLLSLISAVFPIIIQYFLWTAIFSSSESGIVYGYSYSQMIAYTILAAIVTKLIGTGFEYEVLDDIKNGGLNKYIVKPVGYFFYRACCFLGSKLMFFAISAILMLANLLVLQRYAALDIEMNHIALSCIALVLALCLSFLIFFCISMSTFWLTDVYHLFEAARIFIIVISGGIFPIEVLGDTLRSILTYLPFMYTINFPVDIMNGKLQMAQIMQGLEAQLFWIAACTFLANLLWKRGIKNYTAVGG